MQALIVDYEMGNVSSVQKALNFIGINNIISNLQSEISASDFIILPGVGSFNQGMENLKKNNLDKILTNEVINNKKPFLGICLGMQLISTSGTENEYTKGLNWVNGQVKKIEITNKRIPHLGWNNITSVNNSFMDDFDKTDFYFIHSYHFEVENEKNIAAFVEYGEKYVAAIQSENIFATQFHPEKSQKQGIKLIENFLNYYA
jgi:glutamine amidotransferase